MRSSLWWLGLYGATIGPKMPTTMSVKTIKPPTYTFGRIQRRSHEKSVDKLVTDSRVNDRIESVNNEIDSDKSYRVRHD